MPTVILIVVLLVSLATSLLLHAWFLQLGTRWLCASPVSYTRSILAILARTAIDLATCAIVLFGKLNNGPAILVLVLGYSIGFVVLAKLLRTTFWRGVGAWTLTLTVTAASWAVAAFVLKPHFAEAFAMPTNSMAPTILGVHLTGTCPRCGSPAYGSIPHELRGLSEAELQSKLGDVAMICSKEMKPCIVNKPAAEIAGGDRILVAKKMVPRRWDLIVFRFPADPETPFVKRLIGLPGEEIVIRDGAAWADGVKLVPPPEVGPLHYVDRFDGAPDMQFWGTTDRPAKLGPDELFVLGDNSNNAADSRLWSQGAPGHPPYAVPTDHVIGVVTHLYWPISRWRAFR